MKTSATEEKKSSNPMTDLADIALKNYEQAVRAGLKLQEETGRWWNSALNQTPVVPDWKKQWTNASEMVNGLIPLAQKRTEDVLELMEKTSRVNTDLVKKAVDAAQAPVLADSQAKWMEFWNSSLGAARSTAESLTQINTRAAEAWMEFVQKHTEVTETRGSKAA